MEIIDAQVHAPHPGRPLDEAYGEELAYVMGIELAREAMDSVGVDVAVFTDTLLWIERAVQMYPDRFGGSLQYDPNTPDPDTYIARLRQMPGLVSIRLPVTNWQTMGVREPFASGQLEPTIVAAEHQGMPIFFSASANAKALEPVAQKHPGLTMVLDHLGLPSPPPQGPAAPDLWAALPDVVALAKYPNVSLKFTGVTCLSEEAYPYQDLWPRLNPIIEAYGPDRLIWGSDFTRLRMGWGSLEQGPRDKWAGLYSENVHFLLDTSELSRSDKEKIFGLTLRRVLRWPKVPSIDGLMHR
jgi:predicted TIM-barrel fold metal-dependent hydrolase